MTADSTALSAREGATVEERNALEAMRAEGIATEEEIFVDFFAPVAEKELFYLPGQNKVPEKYKAYFEVQRMTEGVRRTYQKKTSSKVTILKENSNAEMGVDPARDREALIKASVVGWRMFRRDPAQGVYEVGYTDRAFAQWYDNADPKIIDRLEQFIRSINPWMLDQLSVDAIDEEIDRLEKLREDVKAREEDNKIFPEAS